MCIRDSYSNAFVVINYPVLQLEKLDLEPLFLLLVSREVNIVVEIEEFAAYEVV